MKRPNPASLLLTTLLLGILLPAPALVGRSQQARVHPDVWEALRDGDEAELLIVLAQRADLSGASLLRTKEAKGRYVHESLQAASRASQQGLKAFLDTRGVEYRSFYLVNAIQVRVDDALLRLLAAHPGVERILLNPAVRGVPDLPSQPLTSRAPQGIEANLMRVHADDVWALGYSGHGLVVAGQDTGYDWDHPALKAQYRGWDGSSADHDCNWHDAIHEDDPNTPQGNPCGFDSAEPCDDHGSSHGTHTMGIAVGDDGQGNQIGMAPGAEWIGCRNMEQGWGTPASYIECFEFFLAPYPRNGTPADGLPELAPDVVNNSWACPKDEGCVDEQITLLQEAVENLRQAGILVVAAAGNYGPACGTVRYPPAIYPQSVAVGNFSHRTDQIYISSSRGPVTYGSSTFTAPDLTAPGVRIYSSIRGGGYGTLTGTSMSAPHVAGAVALLLSAAPGYRGQVDAIEHLLASSTEPMTTTEGCGGDGPADVPNNTWGWGILDVAQAVELGAVTGLLEGTVTDKEQAAPLVGATVAVDRATAPQDQTDGAGHYALVLSAGTYSVTAVAEGYFAESITGVQVTTATVQVQDFALVPHPRLYLPLVAKDS